MYTGEVKLTRTWITKPTGNPGSATYDSVVSGSIMTDNALASLDGGIWEYAGNRTVAVSRLTRSTSVPMQLLPLTLQDVNKLFAWTGSTVLLRTADGQRLWSVFWQVAYKRMMHMPSNVPFQSAPAYTVAIQFTSVSYDEAAVTPT